MTTTSSTAMPSVWTSVNQRLGISPMDHLYNRLDGAYPNIWRANFQTPAAIQNWRETWAEAFADEGVTFDDVKNGIRTCRKMYDKPPSLTEFLKACRPPIDHEGTFYIAQALEVDRAAGRKCEWPSRAVYWASSRVGSFDMRSNAWPMMKSRWTKALDAALADDRAGKLQPIPEYVPALQHQTGKMTEAGKAELAKNLKQVGYDPSKPADREDVIAMHLRVWKANRFAYARPHAEEALRNLGASERIPVAQ